MFPDYGAAEREYYRRTACFRSCTRSVSGATCWRRTDGSPPASTRRSCAKRFRRRVCRDHGAQGRALGSMPSTRRRWRCGADFWVLRRRGHHKTLSTMARYSFSRASPYDCWRSRRCAEAISKRRGCNEKKHSARFAFGGDHERPADLLLSQSIDDHRRRGIGAGRPCRLLPGARVRVRRAARVQSRSRRGVRAGSFQRLFLRADARLLHRHVRRGRTGTGERTQLRVPRELALSWPFCRRTIDAAISHR